MSRLDLETATPLLRHAYDYWSSKCDGRIMPARNDLQPAEMKPLLPNLILMDVLHDAKPGWALDFRYRLIGTELETRTHGRYTGLCMSELPHQRPPSQIWRSLQAVTEARRPQLNRVPYVGPHQDFMSVIDVVMPLSTDGETVDMLFCAIDFLPRSSALPG